MKNGEDNKMVYSTNPNFKFEIDEEASDDKQVKKQNFKVFPDRKNRKGKTVTIVSGYIGNPNSLKELEKKLKSLCGCGGSVKDQEIILQGNVVQKVAEYLRSLNFGVKISGV